jgi:cytoskeletal protein CcmA (bactofilin family)
LPSAGVANGAGHAPAASDRLFPSAQPVQPIQVKPQPERFSIPAVAPVPSAVTQDKPKVPDKQSVMPDPQTKNILSKDVEIKGNIKFTNELVIDGKIEGEIASDGVLTVGENADIRGEIKTKSVTVLGKVNGNITVTERCELKARAHLVGDLKASRLVIEEGATFVGKSEVTMNKAALPISKTIESSNKEESKTPAFSGAR